ncbi:hypothetical protein HC752_23810 [Vibrio sp. S9_S30]|uniref:hypothetical protein n=1 Tax=Vibrio sp. S9_S30 TaxID=2720226 RepID=UPI001680CFDB|nr:hypothetical protein [Vibrio sp. S9_S30]MBD1559952.1 hypothetical protein [Vibrio sp. S9_S30]
MNFLVLTQEKIYKFDSNFINYFYPSDKMYTHCIQINNNNITNKELESYKNTKYAGPLNVLPNNNNGEKRKQAFLKELDRQASHQATKTTNRLHWGGKAIPPSPKARSLAPVLHGSSLTKQTTSVAGRAMAVGIILQTGRSMILYTSVKEILKKFAKKISEKYKDAEGAVFSVNIIYLKVSREYGSAPILGSIHLLKTINPADNYSPNSFVNESINSICQPSYKSTSESIESIKISNLENKNQYGTATLFVQCKW